MLDFYKTWAGRKFVEVDFASIADSLARIANAIEEKGVNINYTPPAPAQTMGPWEKVGMAEALITQAISGFAGMQDVYVIDKLYMATKQLELAVNYASQQETKND